VFSKCWHGDMIKWYLGFPFCVRTYFQLSDGHKRTDHWMKLVVEMLIIVVNRHFLLQSQFTTLNAMMLPFTPGWSNLLVGTSVLFCGVVRAVDLRSAVHGFESQTLRYQVQPWSSCSYTWASVTKWYQQVGGNTHYSVAGE